MRAVPWFRLVTIPARTAFLFLLLALLITAAPSGVASESRVVLARLAPGTTALFLADANGKNERPLTPPVTRDYNASFSSDGEWIVFTSERAGSADVYRMHRDGSGLERLTENPAFDDQGALSPDGKTLADLQHFQK